MTVKSMTGFGRGTGSFGGLDFTIDIKSVNHRFFDFSARIYKDYAFLEEPIKKRVAEAVSRGKVDIYFHTEKSAEETELTAKIDQNLVRAYLDAAEQLKNNFDVHNDLAASRLLTLPDVLMITQPDVSDEEVTAAVLAGVDQALDAFLAMREAEGAKLKADLLDNLRFIASSVERVEELAPASVDTYRQRLEEKLREILEDRNVDESRLLTEVAIFADKVAVDEETVRLRSHLSQFESWLKQGGPIGKKLDFLVQEMNREINTIGSKCNSIEITKIVVDVKSCIEKIREQIQNVE
ncbi:MAG: YicC family protein [Clostridia bacterium]|nr:YicC family protein [Clostridia bacterium]